MSQETGNTPPLAPLTPSDRQPLRAIKKAPRWRSILVSMLGVIGLLVLGALGGYGSGIGERKAAQSSAISQQLMEQFQYALVDEQFGRYSVAKQRLEFIIQNGPSFPGVQNELAKVLVLMTIPTPTPTLPPTPTPDLRGEQSLFATAQQLITSGDWLNALNELDQLRKMDPNFNTSQVDGMYYFALRNYGVDLIQKQGNLEGGIYELTLAERFCSGSACLDNTAIQLREGARDYIQAASYFGVDWSRAAAKFAEVYAGWPTMWDGSMNAAHRYQIALMRYGDKLWGERNACEASDQYQLAESIGQLDDMASKNANQAYQECNPAPTDIPAELPTEAPTAVPAP
jgi:hypothetical protein